MEISLRDAEGRLTELVERVEAGESVTLMKNGAPAARLIAAGKKPTPAEKMRFLEEFQARAAAKPSEDDVSAARSQDFLYDENGLPA